MESRIYIEALLGIVATLFGGLNIFQFFSWKTEKRKLLAEVKSKEAEAEEAHINAKQKSIDLQQDQYDFILQKLTKYQEDYLKLSDQMMQNSDQYIKKRNELLAEIDEKSNEISVLKCRVTYLSGLRCYRSNCQQRIDQNPDHKKD